MNREQIHEIMIALGFIVEKNYYRCTTDGGISFFHWEKEILNCRPYKITVPVDPVTFWNTVLQTVCYKPMMYITYTKTRIDLLINIINYLKKENN